MTDVRLTALNPVDSQVYPVACNTSGELIVEQVDPGPDLTVTGDLTVDGASTFDGSCTFLNAIVQNNWVDDDIGGVLITSGTDSGAVQVKGKGNSSDVAFSVRSGGNSSVDDVAQIKGDGSASFAGELQARNINANYRQGRTGSVFQGYTGVAGEDPANFTSQINSDGSATFSGNITCSDNTKGLVLKSPNGTSYRITVANDGTLGTI